MKQKIISGFVAFALILSFLPAKVNAVVLPAIVGGATIGSASGVVAYAGSMMALGSLLVNNALEILPDLVEAQRDEALNAAATLGHTGNLGSLTVLERRLNSINRLYSNPGLLDKFLDATTPVTLEQASQITAFFQSAGLYPFKITEIEVGSGDSLEYRWVITDERETVIVADSIGRYPYAIASHDQFIPEDNVKNAVELLSEADLSRKFSFLQAEGASVPFKYMEYTHFGEKYKVIAYRGNDGTLNLYGTEDGYFFGYRLEDNYAGSLPRDPVEVETPSGENVTIEDGSDMEIDVDSDLYFMPDGTLALIEQLLYDPQNKTYTISATNSFNTTNNTYYEFNTTNVYFIEYTSVTYIGSTGEYTEEYKYYYELPDGRSSADLTADELEALNTYIDVLPYIRSADDTSIRALYHFDGDTLDSSYWSHIGNFGWDKGASITYLEANAFNGCLYLDETEHRFHIQLPSNIGSKDFTMQFRYYQSYTASPQLDSYVSFGGTKLIQFNGASLLDGSGTVLNAISIGNWQEICVQRIDGTLSIFLNGVPVGTSSLPGVFFDSIQFVFGSSQQTYKYFDEFRFVSEAVYPASGYTPSSVPFDTNLALVLPDSSVPVADEYWSFTSSKVNLLREYDLADWWGQFALASDYLHVINQSPYWHKYSASGSVDVITWSNLPSPVSSCFPHFTYNSVLTSVTGVDGVSFQTYNGNFSGAGSGSQSLSSYWVSPLYDVGGKTDSYGYVGNCGFTTCLGYNISGVGSNYPLTLGGTYTFSVVTADGVVHSHTFTLPSSLSYTPASSLSVLSDSLRFDGYQVAVWDCGVSRYQAGQVGRMLWLSVTANFDSDPPSQEFIYWELVEGSSTDLKAEFVEDVVAVDRNADLNTPSLAVRTDQTITGYQIGGVRPSLPQKGLVWALVESSRITSLQIYNGQAWVEVDGRIWTGQRWVPYYAYDVLLLKDLYDVVGANPDKDYIYTEPGFWSWLQTAWGQMMAKLEQIRVAITDGTGGGSGGDSSTLPDVPPTTPDADDGWSFVDLVVTLADGTWTVVTRTVGLVFNGVSDIAGSVVHIGNLFDTLDPDSSTGIFVIPLE